MERVHSYGLLVTASLGLAACISSPEQPPAPGHALLTLDATLELQGSTVEGPLGAALAFTTDYGNELRLVAVPTQGTFPTRFTLDISEPPPADILYSLQEGEPELAYGYLTATGADLPASLRVANSNAGYEGCSDGACVAETSWCSQTNDPAQDVCYTETRTCDLNHQNCTLVSTGDVTLKNGPWGTLAGVSSNYLVLYLDAAAERGSLTALAFAEGTALGAGYHLLAVHTRSEAELEAASACSDRSQQLALDRYNEKHGTQLEDPVDLSPEGEDEWDALFFGAQIELRCPQTEKRYTPVAHPGTIDIELSRDQEALYL